MSSTYVDELTGEHLADISQSGTRFEVMLTPKILNLLRDCSTRDDIPTEITDSVFYAHYHRDEGGAVIRYPVSFVSDEQRRAALGTLPRLIAAAREFV